MNVAQTAKVCSIVQNASRLIGRLNSTEVPSIIRRWVLRVGLAVRIVYISVVGDVEPGSPWENGYIESFDGKLRDELLNLEIFDTMIEAKVLIERWRRHYNQIRPHSSLGYVPPAPGINFAKLFTGFR